jgi:hypothetical protein
MTKYNVHIFREMRVTFGDIEADTPEAAAAIAREKATDEADEIEDCEGESFSALIDDPGEPDYRVIDFEPERQRQAAAALLTVLKWALPYIKDYQDGFDRVTCDAQVKAAQALFDREWQKANAAVAKAEATGITPAPAEIDVHALLAERRQIAAIWSIEDVKMVAPNLTDDQCWEVLLQAERRHDATIGINWDVLISHADRMLGETPNTDEPEEA